MTTSSDSIKPVFSSAEEEPLLSKPLSKLAIVSLVLGAISLLSPVTGALVPVAIIASIVGLVSSYQLSRQDSTQSGAWLANVGLFLGLLSFSSSSIIAKTNRDSLSSNAGEFASHFLEVLADGRIYEALELQQTVTARQLPGLDLQTYYESYEGPADDKDIMIEGSAPEAKVLAKRRVIDLRANEVTKYVQKFPEATWPFVELGQISVIRANLQMVRVVMTNSAETSKQIQLTLERQWYDDNGKTVADWCVRDMKLL